MDYEYGFNGSDYFSDFLGPAFWILGIIYLIIIVIILASLWKIYVKAGKPGWAAIIPFYNLWVFIEIVGRPSWWFWMIIVGGILTMIPILGILIAIALFVLIIMLYIDLAKSFGKSVGFAIGLIFLSFIFLPILGFGNSQYLGPAASQSQLPSEN